MLKERVAGIGTAVDLGSDEILADAKRRRHLAQHTDKVEAVTDHLRARALRQQAKASRLHKASNGRAKCVREAQTCMALVEVLRQALQGDKIPEFHIPDPSAPVRAGLELLRELQAA